MNNHSVDLNDKKEVNRYYFDKYLFGLGKVAITLVAIFTMQAVLQQENIKTPSYVLLLGAAIIILFIKMWAK